MGNRNSLKRVLTIQSHVTYGYVGNSAAVFSLQRLGIEAMPLHTVQFSNHTGYELFTGDIFSAEHLRSVVSGLEQNHILERIDAVLTGYLGSTETGDVVAEIVAKIRAKNPELLYLRSEEHTSELQSRFDLVCRLLLEKKKQDNDIAP